MQGDSAHDKRILLDAWVSYWDFQKKNEEAKKREEEKKERK